MLIKVQSPVCRGELNEDCSEILERWMNMKRMEYLNSFPVGYRFWPTDEELLTHYLKNFFMNKPLPPSNINCSELDIYMYGPQDLSAFFRKPGEKIMYFLGNNDQQGPIRVAGTGVGSCFMSERYWKRVSGDITIGSKENPIGYKKTVYYQGKPEESNAKETSWILEEYSIEPKTLNGILSKRFSIESVKGCVINKVYNKDEIHDYYNNTATASSETVALTPIADNYLLQPPQTNQPENCNCNCSTVVRFLYNKFMCLVMKKNN